MDKHLFDQAMGDPPPSTVDVDGLIVRERRAAWVRRAAIPWAGAVLGIIGVTFGAVAVMAPGEPGSIGPAQPETTTSKQAPTTAPSTTPQKPANTGMCEGGTPTGPPSPEQPAAAITRLTGVLTSAVQQHVAPGTQLQKNPASEYPKGTPHGPLEFYHILSQVENRVDGSCKGGEDYFMARANTVNGVQKGNILVVISRLGGNTNPQTQCDMSGSMVEQTACERQVGPNGEIIVAQTLSLEGGATVFRTEVTKPDGTGVLLFAENVADDAKSGGGPDSPTPPLSFQQMITIALNPGMTMYP